MVRVVIFLPPLRLHNYRLCVVYAYVFASVSFRLFLAGLSEFQLTKHNIPTMKAATVMVNAGLGSAEPVSHQHVPSVRSTSSYVEIINFSRLL